MSKNWSIWSVWLGPYSLIIINPLYNIQNIKYFSYFQGYKYDTYLVFFFLRVLERLERFTGAKIISSIDSMLKAPTLGCCGSFYVERSGHGVYR